MARRRPDRLWDRLATMYDRHADEDEELAAATDRARSHLAADAVVLDVGCGTGVAGLRLAPHVATVHGLDTSARMIELANDRLAASGRTNVHFHQGDLTHGAVPDEGVDGILIFNLLHLVPDPLALLRQARDRLGPRHGVLVLLVPCAAQASLLARAFTWLVPKVRLLSHLHRFHERDVLALLREAGFEVVEADDVQHEVPALFVVARPTEGSAPS